MFLVYAALVILASVPLLGGRMVALADFVPRRSWLVAAALGAQILVTTVMPGVFDGAGAAVHLATYGLLIAFLWANLHVPGIVPLAAGTTCNIGAISLNAGVMPASESALERAGLPYDKSAEFANSAAVEGAYVPWLGDVFAIPASWPASNVFSIGDVLILVGLAVTLHALTDSRAAVAARRLRPAGRTAIA